MIRDFESWSNLVEVSQLEELKGLRVGIEASDFLRQRILNHPRNKEPLVPALGGLPLAFNQHISNDLSRFQDLGITPFFVFSGLDIAKHDNLTQQRREGADTNAAAWALYDQHYAEKAVERFGESTYVAPEDLFRALQATLVEHKLQFMVAPYSAWAQVSGTCSSVRIVTDGSSWFILKSKATFKSSRGRLSSSSLIATESSRLGTLKLTCSTGLSEATACPTSAK